ncbi:MAG: hypothetical protein NC393_09590 [Clostridium sp.]|nr:hypothetical protein [Clostridium sp.]MCM1207795.1 hypothetical protein [Ruminococcus sp.]
MTYEYYIEKDGEYVDLKTLPLEEQAEIRKRLSETMATTIAKNIARQRGKEISNNALMK